MGRAQYKLRRDVMTEKGKIEKAGAKRGLWSKIGMALGGLVAMGLTGGAAAPAVAALAAGAGTAAGGFAGRQLAAKSKGGKIRGGKFFQDERESLIGQIDESIWAGALKSGLSAGALSFMGGAMPKLGYSTKGGLSITAGGGKAAAAGTEAAATAGGKGIPGMFSKAFKGGESAHTYSDSLLGKVGKALDVKGSAIGSKVGTMMHEGGWTGKELTDWGEESLGTATRTPDSTLFTEGEYGASADFPQSRRHAQFAPGEITSRVEGAETAARIKEGGFLQFDDPGQYARQARDVDYLSTPLELTGRPGKTDYLGSIETQSPFYKTDITQATESARISEGLKDSQFSDFAEGMRSDTGRLVTPTSGGPGIDETSNFPVGESADVTIDQGLIGPLEADIPFDRSSMLRRQATARMQGQASPTGISGSGTDFTGTAAWEGVGETFGVTSPDLLGNIGESFTQSPSYDYMNVLNKKRQGMASSLQWHNKLFGE